MDAKSSPFVKVEISAEHLIGTFTAQNHLHAEALDCKNNNNDIRAQDKRTQAGRVSEGPRLELDRGASLSVCAH